MKSWYMYFEDCTVGTVENFKQKITLQKFCFCCFVMSINQHSRRQTKILNWSYDPGLKAQWFIETLVEFELAVNLCIRGSVTCMHDAWTIWFSVMTGQPIRLLVGRIQFGKFDSIDRVLFWRKRLPMRANSSNSHVGHPRAQKSTRYYSI